MRCSHLALALLMSCTPWSSWAADLIMVRHGNSDHNMANEYNSNPKHPNYRVSHLTTLGRDQARAAAQKLLKAGYKDDAIQAVYVSPLPRTQETARLMAEEGLFHPSKIILDERLIEVQAGDREGLSTDIFDGDHWERHDTSQYQGETNTEVKKRVLSLYDHVAAQNPEKHVLFVSHGMAAYELIDTLTLQRIRLQTAECMVLPLKNRNPTSFFADSGNASPTNSKG